MNKFFKKLAVLLSFVMVFTAMPMSVFAEGEVATTLPEAVNGVITLTEDVVLEDTFTVPAGTTLTLDLAGHTISQVKECTGSYEMISNKGNLTITGNGKLSFKDTSAGDPSFGWGSYTIRNEGTLVVENGTIEHLGEQNGNGSVKHMYCAIFQYSGSSEINGGTISTPTYRSVRLWHGDMTINAGQFNGQIWVQTQTGVPAKLTINEGTFAPKGVDGSSLYVTNDKNTVDLSITGGNFTTKIGSANSAALAGSVTGGIFAVDPTPYVAPTSFVTKVGENWVVEAADANAVSSEAELKAVLETDATNIKFDSNIDLSTAVVITKDVTVDLAGKTITLTEDTVGDGAFHVTGGTLTINDSVGGAVINGVGKNNYSMALWADGGHIVINAGKYTNVGAGSDDAYDLIYAKNSGTVKIYGGTFEAHTPKWTLNQHDSTNGKITVYGGEFAGVNPAEVYTEPTQPISFVATGYVSVKEGEYWVVKDKASIEHKVEAEVPVIDNTKQEAQATVDTTANAGAVEAAAKQVLDVLNNENTTVAEKQTAIDNLAIDADAKTALKEAVATEKEVTVIIEVGAKEMDSTEIATEQAKVDAIDDKLDEDETVAAYLDLSVTKSIAVNGVEVPGTETELTEIPQPLAFTVAYPKDVPAVPEGMVRVWVVYRAHGNEVTELAVTDNGDGTGVFHTDKFSVYALAYKDVPAAHEHVWGYNTQYDAAAHWDYCHVCGAQNTPVAHSDTNGDGICNDCGYVMVKGITSNRQNPNTGVTADMLK